MSFLPICRGRGPARARRVSRRVRLELTPLEPKRLLSGLSAVEPSADEQYMLQLVNRARANPQAEGQRLAAIARTDPTVRAALAGSDASAFLREINSHAAQAPLAFNPRLIASARAHDAAMVAANSQFHTDITSLVRPADPSQAAPDGQPYFPVGNSSWSAAENVYAYSGNLKDPRGKPLVDYFHAGFLIDWGNPDFGHLRNLLRPGPGGASGGYALSEIGIGIITDARPSASPSASIAANRGIDVGPALVTQQFGWRSGHQFLTGAVFADRDGDAFYTPGEGLGGVKIEAVGRNGEGTYVAIAWGSGGYAIDLPRGTYDVTAKGGGLAEARTASVTIGADNVGWDVAVPSTQAPPVAPPGPGASPPPPAAKPPGSTSGVTQAANSGKANKVLAARKAKKLRRLARLRPATSHPKPPRWPGRR